MKHYGNDKTSLEEPIGPKKQGKEKNIFIFYKYLLPQEEQFRTRVRLDESVHIFNNQQNQSDCRVFRSSFDLSEVSARWREERK